MKHQRPFWLVALLVLVFVGQSLAAVAMPCRLMDAGPNNMPHSMNHEMSQMNHSMAHMDHSMMNMHHDMSHMDDSQSGDMNSTHDCCKTIGQCSSGSCSAPALTYHLELNLASNNLPLTSGYHQHIPNSPVSSLYRPPILG